MTAPYQLAIGSPTAVNPSQVVTVFSSWQLQRNFDDGTSLSFVCPGNSIAGAQIAELSTDVWLYQDNVLIERLRIVEVNHVWNADGYYELAVMCVDYRRLLKSRHLNTALTFTAINQGTIVRDVIAHTQAQTNGSLGITYGTISTTVTRTRDYLAGSNILDLIVDLSQAENGVAWSISPTKVLTVTEAAFYPNHPQPVVLGMNALSIRKPSGASQFANVALVSGDTQYTTLEIQASSGIATDARGRWERYSAFSQIAAQANLEEQAIGLLDQTVSPSVLYEFEIEPGKYFSDSDYQLGDFVSLVEPTTYIPSSVNPIVPLSVIPGSRINTQIVAQSITLTADGEVHVQYSAVRAPQRWDDLPPLLTWDSLDPAITWENLTNYYFN
jgi:hypothetical protein